MLHKEVPKKCEKCGETEDNKFSTCIYNICKECKKLKSSKTYLCKICGVIDERLFYEGRYGNCKKCYNSKKNNNAMIVKFIDEKYKDSENEIKEGISNFEIKGFLKKTIKYDTDVMDGQSIKQYIEEIKLENIVLSQNVENNEKQISMLMKENSKHLISFEKIQNQYEKLKLSQNDEIQKMKAEYDAEIQELKKLIMEMKENKNV